jgi:hypothetical protein
MWKILRRGTIVPVYEYSYQSIKYATEDDAKEHTDILFEKRGLPTYRLLGQHRVLVI